MTVIEQRTMEAFSAFCRKHTSNEINWEQRRYEVAKDAMVAMLSNPAILSQIHSDGTLAWKSAKPLVRVAVENADFLINELKATQK